MSLEGKFREDLFFRLACVTIANPPLRSRPEDVPALVHHFLEEFAKRNSLTVPAVSALALQGLAKHTWPGNVRELRHVTEVLGANSIGQPIDVENVDAALEATASWSQPATSARPDTMEGAERDAIVRALEACGGNKKEASKLLKISRSTLYVKLMRFRIRTGSDEPS